MSTSRARDSLVNGRTFTLARGLVLGPTLPLPVCGPRSKALTARTTQREERAVGKFLVSGAGKVDRGQETLEHIFILLD